MWNSLITLKYGQGHWQSYHVKAVVSKMFGRQWTKEAKIANFNDSTLIWRPISANPREYLHKPYTARNYITLATFLPLIAMSSSANFGTVFSESQNASTLDAGPDFNAKWPFKVIQGHPFRRQWRAINGLHIVQYIVALNVKVRKV